jgi:hypothetical protein
MVDSDKGMRWYHWLILAIAVAVVLAWVGAGILVYMSGGGHV